MAVVARHAAARVAEFLETFRLVVLQGVRQSGKTTLVSELLKQPRGSMFSFDEDATLARAVDDPVGFVASLPRPAVVDEYQRAGQPFLLAVKQAVDADRRRGQLLLTGSASYLADRQASETLPGRTGRVRLWPLSAGERRGVLETFVDRCLDPDPESWPPSAVASPDRDEVVEWILEGGYPEIVTERLTGRRRRAWFEAYVEDVVSREALRPLADVRMESELRLVLRLLAARTGNELVVADVAADAGLSRDTTSNYVTLLEALHVVVRVPAWATSATTRVKRHSKVILVDPGLAADLIGAGQAAFGPRSDGQVAGSLFETLVITEIYKQATWSEVSVDLAHFRDRNGPEVDLIVEDRRTGSIAGIEVKLTATPKKDHARHLALLRDRLGERFNVGLVVHAGRHSLPLGDKLWAVPISALWRND